MSPPLFRAISCAALLLALLSATVLLLPSAVLAADDAPAAVTTAVSTPPVASSGASATSLFMDGIDRICKDSINFHPLPLCGINSTMSGAALGPKFAARVQEAHSMYHYSSEYCAEARRDEAEAADDLDETIEPLIRALRFPISKCELAERLSEFSEALSAFGIAVLERVLACGTSIPYCSRGEEDADVSIARLTRTLESTAAAIRSDAEFVRRTSEEFEQRLAELIAALQRDLRQRIISEVLEGIACNFPDVPYCSNATEELRHQTRATIKAVLHLLEVRRQTEFRNRRDRCAKRMQGTACSLLNVLLNFPSVLDFSVVFLRFRTPLTTAMSQAARSSIAPSHSPSKR
jgi:hypothetical protein